MLSGMLRVLIVGLVLLVAALFLLPRPGGDLVPEVATFLPQPRELPAVALVDDRGEPAGLELLRGRYSLLFFGFTNCPDVCPLTLKVLADARAAVRAADEEATPDVLFVSVDAARDTPERIRAYLNGFDSAFRGVTGPDEALEPLLRTLGVAVEKHEHGGESYNVVHSSVVFFVSPDAEVIGVSSAPHDAAKIAADFRKIRRLHIAAEHAART